VAHHGFPHFSELDHQSYSSFTVDATIMVSNKCPIVDEQVKAFFVMQKATVTTV